VSSNPCPCCKKVEKRKHECTHEFCELNCPKKRTETNSALAEILPPNLSFLLNQSSNTLKKKVFVGGKPVIFGLKPKEDDINSNANNANNPYLINAHSSLPFDGNFNLEKENAAAAMNFNSIFNAVPGKNPIFVSNTHLPNTNLFKSVQVPQEAKNNANSANPANNSFDEESNFNSQHDKQSNSAEKGLSGQNTSGNANLNVNANADNKKCFFKVKK